MTPDPTSAVAQGETARLPQPLSDVYISPAAQRLLGIRMESNGGPAQTTPPAGGGGQGDADGGKQAGGGEGGFNWGNFPDVPEEQRALLEPHLRNVQGHVTKLEQQYAPLKGVLESGLSADDLNGLIALNKSFGEDPLNTWLKLGRDMQGANLLNGDLDLDAVQMILEGKAELDDGSGNEEVPDAGGDGGEQEPQWAREIRDQFKAQQEQETATEQEAKSKAQQEQLDTTLTGMKAQLKEAGYTDEQINAEGFEDLLTSAIITAKGDPDSALKQILMIRDSTLKSLKPNETDKDEDLETTGLPATPKRTRGGKEYAKAREGAKQFLSRQNQSASAE